MKSLYESLLGDIENNVAKTEADMFKAMYPAPKVKDFYKTSLGTHKVQWLCKELIQRYINILNIDNSSKLQVIGLEVVITPGSINELKIHPVIDNRGPDAMFYSLYGVDGSDKHYSKDKKEVIEFFNAVLKNPDLLKVLFEYSNKKYEELKKYGFCDNITLKEILKF